MNTVQDWLDEYSRSHRNPTNRKIHFVCIPLIVYSVICALRAIPVGGPWLNPATLVGAAALAYYAALSRRLAAGMAVVFVVVYAAVLALQAALGPQLVWAAALVFVVAWIGQFYGHHVEGARPSFFKDLQFLLIGPLWELAHLYEALGVSVHQPPAAAAEPS